MLSSGWERETRTNFVPLPPQRENNAGNWAQLGEFEDAKHGTIEDEIDRIVLLGPSLFAVGIFWRKGGC